MIYPSTEDKIFAAWIQDIIESRRTLPQAKYCMQHNPDLRHSSVQGIAKHIRNNGPASYVQYIYKYTSNITGSDPYWF